MDTNTPSARTYSPAFVEYWTRTTAQMLETAKSYDQCFDRLEARLAEGIARMDVKMDILRAHLNTHA